MSKPTLVEVTVERMGIFVRTTSILMCDNHAQAIELEKSQLDRSDALMEEQGEPFISVSTDTGIRLEKSLAR